MINYEQLVDSVIQEHRTSPVRLLGADSEGEYRYLEVHKDSFVRTVRDIDELLGSDKKCRVLEIGSFLGVVSVSLKKLGYDVYALDIPEFEDSENLRGLYERHGIPFKGINLRRYVLPFEDGGTFDVVIACEIIEHLNFNPLPVLHQINKVLNHDGLLYIGMPNQASLRNRLRLFLGKSIHNPIEDFFAQLARNGNMIVGLHWREYTLYETIEMLRRTGFDVVRSYYFSEAVPAGLLKTVLKQVIYSIPAFRPSQVVVSRKVEEPVHDFWLTEANS